MELDHIPHCHVDVNNSICFEKNKGDRLLHPCCFPVRFVFIIHFFITGDLQFFPIGNVSHYSLTHI